MIPLFLLFGFGFAQDAVNPCEILSESLQCTGPGLHGAEIDFKAIKLNGKRKNDPMVSVGEAMIISTKIKYTKRAKAEITTTFNGGCPVRTETKRLKPEVAVSYSATLDGNTFTGSGNEFTINAPLAIGSYPLSVTFTSTAVNGCIDNAPLSETKIFVLDVIDGAFILDVAAVKTGTTTSVDSGAYLCKGQGQQLDLSVTFSDPLNTLPFGSNDIVWTVSPPSAGLFSGPTGANGDTVTWIQADDFVSGTEDDLVITVNAPDMQPHSFYLTVFGINSTSGVLAVNTTQTFTIEASDIAPLDANKTVIVSALGGSTDVGFGTATKLRTRTFTGSSPFNQLENEGFFPSEADQTNPSLQIIKKATFMQVGSNLVVEIEAGPVVGDVNITWEQDRPGGTRQILHREHMTVTSGTPGQTVALQEKITTDAGPLFKKLGDTVDIEAIVTPGSPPPGFPVWTVTPNFSGTVTKPADGDMDFDMSSLPVGHYIVEAKLGPDPLQKDTIEVNITQADIDVDTNRDSVVDDTDDAGEDSWSRPSGAIFAVNYDDDNGLSAGRHPDAIDFDQYGTPINEDYKINHVDDEHDVAPITIRKVGSKSGLQYFLRIDADKIKGIHIFEGRIALSEVLKDSSGDYWTGWNAHHTLGKPNYLDITSYVNEHADLLLGIESLLFPGAKIFPASYALFDGEVEIEFIVQKDTGGSVIDPGNLISSDIVKLRVAPYLLLPNTQHADKVYMESGYASAIPPAPISSGTATASTTYESIKNTFDTVAAPVPSAVPPTYRNRWYQDHVQIGFTGFPNSETFHPTTSAYNPDSLTYATLRLPYQTTQDEWPHNHILKNGEGLFRMRNLFKFGTTGTALNESGDFGGNLELIPFSTAWPLGRILVGNTMSPEPIAFLEAQKVDSGDAVQKPIIADANWLSVGHVDEFVGFVEGGPQGYKVAHADPKLAYDLLKSGKYTTIPAAKASDPLFSTGPHVSGQASNLFTGSTLKFLFDGAAHGKIKVKKKSKFSDGKKLTLKDGTHTVVFEFDDDASVSPGHVAVDVSTVGSEEDVRDALHDEINTQITLGNLDLHLFKDSTDSLILINQAVTDTANESISTTVGGSGIDLWGMGGGEVASAAGLGNGRDFNALMPGKTLRWVRLFSGPGAGQVVKVEASGPGWLKMDTMGVNFYRTTSELVWQLTGGADGFYRRLKSSTVADYLQRANTWHGSSPNHTTQYIVVEQCREWIRHISPSSASFNVPGLWSVHEYLQNMDASSGPKLMRILNEEVQTRINTSLKAIADGMGLKAGGGNFLSTDKTVGSMPYYADADDDHLTTDTNDDFLSVPVIFFGALDPTGSTIWDRSAVALTPGLANFQPVSKDFVVFPKPFMPKVTVSGSVSDIFEAAVRHVMGHTSGNNRVRFADDWNEYHRNDGEVHCGTAAKRKMHLMPWWSMLP